MLAINQRRNCVNRLKRRCHTPGHPLIRTVPRSHRLSNLGTGQDLIPGDRVEGLGDFGMPTGEFGTVRQVNEDDALVKWDDDGRIRVHQPSLKKM